MKFIGVEVISGLTNERFAAAALQCDNCSAIGFHVLDIKGHLHFECIACRTSFCNGKCDEVVTK